MNNILLMLFDDEQRKIDKSIFAEEPDIVRAPDPRLRRLKLLETIYTRLRNEFAHKREGVNLDDTRTGTTNSLAGLVALTKRAIELHS